MKIYALRLQPNTDLRYEIEKLVKKCNWNAAWIITCAGSLHQVCLRMANSTSHELIKGPFEITSLVGTLSKNGVHLHINVSDNKGKVIGGHLCRESVIYTTAEIVIGYTDNLIFSRKYDKDTGYQELCIHKTEESD